MNRNWLLIPLIVVAVVAVLWVMSDGKRPLHEVRGALGLAPTTSPVVKSKPICPQVIVPAGTDCIPQHLADLPPDPGEAGKATIDGIVDPKTGVRVDVLRYIHEQWPDSERARRSLYSIARYKQLAVHHGGDITREEARQLMQKLADHVVCLGEIDRNFMNEAMTQRSASEKVVNKVTNTPERFKRAHDFSYKAAHQVYELPDNNDLPALCGFDPAALPN